MGFYVPYLTYGKLINNPWLISFNVFISITVIFLNIKMHTVCFKAASPSLFLSHRVIITLCKVTCLEVEGFTYFHYLNRWESLTEVQRKGEIMKGEKWCGWWRLRKNSVVFEKGIRNPLFDKNLGCLLFELCYKLSWVRTVLNYLSYLFLHLHLLGTFSTSKNYHFFKV